MEGYVRAQHLLGEGSLEEGWERFLENTECCLFCVSVSLRCVSSRGLRVEVVGFYLLTLSQLQLAVVRWWMVRIGS